MNQAGIDYLIQKKDEEARLGREAINPVTSVFHNAIATALIHVIEAESK